MSFSIYTFFNLINAVFYFLIYINGLSFFIICIRGSAYPKYSLIKFRLKLINLKKDWIFFIFVNVGHSLVVIIFAKSMRIPFFLIIYFKNLISFQWNRHFFNLNLNLILLKRDKNFLILI